MSTYEVYTFHVEAPISAGYMDEMMEHVTRKLADMLDNGEGFGLTVKRSNGSDLANYEASA